MNNYLKKNQAETYFCIFTLSKILSEDVAISKNTRDD